MNKKDLIAAFAERNEMTKKASGEIVESMLDILTDALKNDEKIQIVGFGTLGTKFVPERECRNPKTGGAVVSAAHKKIFFKPGKALKDTVNE